MVIIGHCKREEDQRRVGLVSQQSRVKANQAFSRRLGDKKRKRKRKRKEQRGGKKMAQQNDPNTLIN